jgi:hypothetical protein
MGTNMTVVVELILTGLLGKSVLKSILLRRSMFALLKL